MFEAQCSCVWEMLNFAGEIYSQELNNAYLYGRFNCHINWAGYCPFVPLLLCHALISQQHLSTFAPALSSQDTNW